MVMEDHWLKMREIVHDCQMPSERAHHILTEESEMKEIIC